MHYLMETKLDMVGVQCAEITAPFIQYKKIIMERTTEVPKWFKQIGGTVYAEGAKVENRFGGDSYELNNVELSIYDYLMGCELIGDWEGVRKGLDFFRTHNAKAYMVLLD